MNERNTGGYTIDTEETSGENTVDGLTMDEQEYGIFRVREITVDGG